MANYRQIHVSIWKDQWFLDLNSNEKLLFIYLFSNELASLAGIYKLPIKVIQFETDLSFDFINMTLDKFREDNKVYFEDGIVFILNMRKYNKGSSKVETRIQNDIDEVPDCELKRQYLLYYAEKIPYPYAIGSISAEMNNNEMNNNENYGNGINRNGGGELQQQFPKILLPINCQDIFSEITGMVTIPNSRDKPREDVYEDLTDLRKRYKECALMVADGKKYYNAWLAKKYRKTNNNWIDWWIAEEIPETKEKSKPEPVKPVKDW